jgi:hypothetical protein
MLASRPKQGGVVVPRVDAYLMEDRILYMLDMQHLAGVSREAWLNRNFWKQCRAALGGRRFFVSDGGGLMITVAREPGSPKRKLPSIIPLQADHLVSAPYLVAVGMDIRRRETMILDLAREHRAILIGGYSGSGKTNLMRSIVLQLAAQQEPGKLQVAVVDVKEVDFSGVYNHLPHLFQPIARDKDSSEQLIERIEGERIRRQAILRKAGVTDWRRYNERADDPMSLLVLVVDEAADFAGTPVMDTLVKIARKGRAMGISLIIGTQYPTKDVVHPQIKANLSTAIAFQTTTGTESRVIINRNGAEHLRQKGRCLTFLCGRWCEIQTFFVEEGLPESLTGLTEKDDGPALELLHVELVRHAVEELDGAFIINKLAPVFQGEISRRQLVKLGRAWESRGWLTKPAHATDSRKVTGELLSLCSLPSPREERASIGSQGSQVITGTVTADLAALSGDIEQRKEND